jgi:hypothetical protein
MSALQGLITYPGLTTFKSAEYTASHGIAPGVCTMELPQELVDDLAPVGDLTFRYGDAYVTLSSCVVDLGNTERGGGGYISRLQIYDRRWAWKFGAISGHYNLPAPGVPTSGGVDLGYNFSQSLVRADTMQSAQQLAVLCLQAMGETVYDVSALPDNVMPETHWSHENPAHALEQLCESLGCRVVLDLDNNGVRIVVVGEGADLPDGPIQWASSSVAPQQSPSSLLFVGGQTVQQGFIPLTAVGRDTSGAIVPIDQLNYAPPNGWISEPVKFPSVTTEPARTYAEESVYRWWQPTVPFTAPDGTTVDDLKQLILFDRQLDTNLNPSDPNGATTQRPEIVGYFDPCYAQLTSSPDTLLTYHGSIQVDQNRCLVITGDQLVNCQYNQNFAGDDLAQDLVFAARPEFARARPFHAIDGARRFDQSHSAPDRAARRNRAPSARRIQCERGRKRQRQLGPGVASGQFLSAGGRRPVSAGRIARCTLRGHRAHPGRRGDPSGDVFDPFRRRWIVPHTCQPQYRA